MLMLNCNFINNSEYCAIRSLVFIENLTVETKLYALTQNNQLKNVFIIHA